MNFDKAGKFESEPSMEVASDLIGIRTLPELKSLALALREKAFEESKILDTMSKEEFRTFLGKTFPEEKDLNFLDVSPTFFYFCRRVEEEEVLKKMLEFKEANPDERIPFINDSTQQLEPGWVAVISDNNFISFAFPKETQLNRTYVDKDGTIHLSTVPSNGGTFYGSHPFNEYFPSDLRIKEVASDVSAYNWKAEWHSLAPITGHILF